MSRCFPFPPPGYVKIGERRGEGPIEIESTKLQKEIKKAEKERKREKKREKEKKALLKKQQPGISDGKLNCDGCKIPLPGNEKRTDSVLSDISSRSGLSEEHGQPIPENTFYSSDDTYSSKKRKRDEQSAPVVELKGAKLKLCFSFKKPSASTECTIGREEPTCSTTSLQNPSTVEGQPSQKKSRTTQAQSSFVPKGGDAKSVTNKGSQIRPPSSVQIASVSSRQNNIGSKQPTLSASVAVPELKKVDASESTLPVSGVIRSHPGKKTSLAAPPSSSHVLLGSTDVLLDTGGLKPPQVQGSQHQTTAASQEEILSVNHKSDRKSKSERKESKRRLHDSTIVAMYNSLFMDWVPPIVVSEASTDDQEWLFGSKWESRVVPPRRSDAEAANFVLPGCEWPPRAHYLAEAEIHALPFTVPF